MRLWSLHPKYLDWRGLTAVWREGLLAQKVLSGKTRGYRNHPQLTRFRESGKPVSAIGVYLREIQDEAARRGYAFQKKKIGRAREELQIPVTRGQMDFERAHLLAKMKARDREKYRALRKVPRPAPHPLFYVVRGGVAGWEKGTEKSLRPEKNDPDPGRRRRGGASTMSNARREEWNSP